MSVGDAISDEDLMFACARGEMAAHRVLFGRLAPQIRGVALRALSDPGDADDVVQQTFLQLHRARHDYRRDVRLRPWVFTIAMNLVRDALRRRKRTRGTPSMLDVSFEAAVEPASAKEAKEDAALVHEALATLPDDQRRAIEMHWWEGRSFAEVAHLEGASESAVKVRAHRGLARLTRLPDARGL